MKYNFYIPQKLTGISPLIWEQKTDLPSKWNFLPEFNIDLIFNLDQPWNVHTNCYKSKSFNPTENFCFLSGLHTKPLIVDFPQCHMFGIRLNTISASLLFGIDCKELKNWSVEGALILGDKIHYIQDKMIELSNFRSKAIWLEDFIYSLIHYPSDLKMAIKISTLLDRFCSGSTIAQSFSLEEQTGYSRMHTHRLFKKWFGLSPTEALAFRRFEKALKQIHDSTENLTQIGLNCGFYDQSHFIRVFKNFADMTPKQYVKQKTGMPGQFSP